MDEDRIFTSVGRGVYRAPWQLPNGRWLLVAVARNGRVVDDAEYTDESSFEMARHELKSRLDECDPPSSVRLV